MLGASSPSRATRARDPDRPGGHYHRPSGSASQRQRRADTNGPGHLDRSGLIARPLGLTGRPIIESAVPNAWEVLTATLFARESAMLGVHISAGLAVDLLGRPVSLAATAEAGPTRGAVAVGRRGSRQ